MQDSKEEIELKPEWRIFAEQYVIDWNATRSYRVAYPNASTATAEVNGSKLLRITKVQDYIEKIKNDLSRLSGVTALRNINELAKIAYSNIAEMVDESGILKSFEELTDAQKAAISELYTEAVTINEGTATLTKRKIKLHSKVQAIDLLNKMLGFNAAEKRELSGEIKTNIPPVQIIMDGEEIKLQ